MDGSDISGRASQNVPSHGSPSLPTVLCALCSIKLHLNVNGSIWEMISPQRARVRSGESKVTQSSPSRGKGTVNAAPGITEDFSVSSDLTPTPFAHGTSGTTWSRTRHAGHIHHTEQRAAPRKPAHVSRCEPGPRSLWNSGSVFRRTRRRCVFPARSPLRWVSLSVSLSPSIEPPAQPACLSVWLFLSHRCIFISTQEKRGCGSHVPTERETQGTQCPRSCQMCDDKEARLCSRGQGADRRPAGQLRPSGLFYPAQHLVSTRRQHRALA